MRDGVDVRGYVYWTLLDNFAWIFGYRPTFGLVAVDRTTLDRTVKPSAARYGEIAPSNGAALTGTGASAHPATSGVQVSPPRVTMRA